MSNKEKLFEVIDSLIRRGYINGFKDGLSIIQNQEESSEHFNVTESLDKYMQSFWEEK